MDNYKIKYFKYKCKYLELKDQTQYILFIIKNYPKNKIFKLSNQEITKINNIVNKYKLIENVTKENNLYNIQSFLNNLQNAIKNAQTDIEKKELNYVLEKHYICCNNKPCKEYDVKECFTTLEI
jgi:hypothetical protein